jgi:cell division protease FtsH
MTRAASGPFKNKNLILILFMALLFVFLYKLYSEGSGQEKLNRTEFYEWMSNPEKEIVSLKLQRAHDGIIVSGERKLSEKEIAERASKGGSLMQSSKREVKNTAPFNTHLLNVTEEQISEWEVAKKLKVTVIHEKTSWLEHLFFPLFTILIIIFFWIMISRQSSGGGGRGLFSFGKSKARLIDTGKSNTTFKDVAGADEAKQDLEEVIHFLKNPKKYDKVGGRIPKGVLLVGPPGTGKTLLGRAVAGEAGVPFFSMSGSDFVEMFVGVGASRVRDLFENGKKHAPCILFIDEIDAVGRQRGAGVGGGHDEREQTLNQLLVEMDGFSANEGVILLAATNRPDVLDKALLRPGRFDRQIVVDLPDQKGREEILKVHLNKRKVPLADDVDITTVAKGTPGLAGADLENLVNEAALLAARFNADQVGMVDFEEARDKLWMGAERKTLIMSKNEIKSTAYHEAGHALINLLVKNADPLHKITIIPRGRALGVTMSLPERDRVSLSKDQVLDQIAILMAGRASEKMMFGYMNTGAANDIERASDLARRCVTDWGFSDELGPVSYGRRNEEIFLGREITQHRDFSESTAVKIDRAVREIIDAQSVRAIKLLEENKDKLILLAEALLEHEVLDREEIDRVMAGETLETTKKSRLYTSRKEAVKIAESEVSVAAEPKLETAVAKTDADAEAKGDNPELQTKG